MKIERKAERIFFLMLCVLITAGILAQGAMAVYPTGACTNIENEGIDGFDAYGIRFQVSGISGNIGWRFALFLF